MENQRNSSFKRKALRQGYFIGLVIVGFAYHLIIHYSLFIYFLNEQITGRPILDILADISNKTIALPLSSLSIIMLIFLQVCNWVLLKKLRLCYNQYNSQVKNPEIFNLSRLTGISLVVGIAFVPLIFIMILVICLYIFEMLW